MQPGQVHNVIVRVVNSHKYMYNFIAEYYYRCLIFYDEAVDILYQDVPLQYYSTFTELLTNLSIESHSIVIEDCRFDEMLSTARDFDRAYGTGVQSRIKEQAYFMLDYNLREKYLKKVRSIVRKLTS